MFGKNKKFNKAYWRRHRLPIILLVIALVIVGALVWHWHGNANNYSAAASQSAGPSLIEPDKTSSLKNTQNSDSPKSPATSNIASGSTLSAPSRIIYASDYAPSKSTDTELSSLATTPGATAQIVFTKDGITRSLPAKQADSNGSISWYWTPSQIGLTAGSWKPSVTVTLGSQTKTASDTNVLQIP